MKRKTASESMTLTGQTVGPRPDLEAAERLKAILRTRADDQFELDLLFGGNPKIRHETRKKLERLLVQSEAAETMAPGLQRDMSKMAFVTDEEAKILGLEKRAGKVKAAALVVGEQLHDGLDHAAIPEATRKKLYKAYIDGKAAEKATSWLKSMGIGAAIGAPIGALAAHGSPGVGAAAGALGGAAIGGLANLMDRGELERVKDIKRRRAYSEGLADDVAAMAAHRDNLRELRAERRHHELKDALRKTASIAPNVDAWFEKNASVLKKAGLPTPAISAKATRVTAKAGAGRGSAQSNLSGGSA